MSFPTTFAMSEWEAKQVAERMLPAYREAMERAWASEPFLAKHGGLRKVFASDYSKAGKPAIGVYATPSGPYHGWVGYGARYPELCMADEITWVNTVRHEESPEAFAERCVGVMLEHIPRRML